MKAKKTIKGSNHNAVSKTEPVVHDWFDYRDMFSNDMKPMNSRGIETLGMDLKKWARDDKKAYKISQFHLERGISKGTWRDWVVKFPQFREDVEMAKAFIGDRREIGMLENKLYAAGIAYTMPFYDDEWKTETERRAALKSEAAGDGKENITVVLNPIPNSEIVLQRNTRDKDDISNSNTPQ